MKHSRLIISLVLTTCCGGILPIPLSATPQKMTLDSMVRQIVSNDPKIPQERGDALVDLAKIMRQFAYAPDEEQVATSAIIGGQGVMPPPGAIVRCVLAQSLDHTGIFVGDNRIIHRDGDGFLAEVEPEVFLDRLSGANNATIISVICDATGKPLANSKAADFARKALSDSNENSGYNLFTKNCHQFCLDCWTKSIPEDRPSRKGQGWKMSFTFNNLTNTIASLSAENINSVGVFLRPWKSSLIDAVQRAGHKESNMATSRPLVSVGELELQRLGTASLKKKILTVEELTDHPVTTWVMPLPVDGDFMPNVNIFEQFADHDMSLDDYIDLSRQQYGKAQVGDLSVTKLNESIADFEVSAFKFRGNTLHCIQRVIRTDRHFYLVTGTTLESQWDRYRDQMNVCVKSAYLRK